MVDITTQFKYIKIQEIGNDIYSGSDIVAGVNSGSIGNGTAICIITI